jgi:hypothetical protein
LRPRGGRTATPWYSFHQPAPFPTLRSWRGGDLTTRACT